MTTDKGKPKAIWPFSTEPPVFEWEDPRSLDAPSLQDGEPSRYLVDRKTGAVQDIAQPELYFQPVDRDIWISLSSFSIAYFMGAPRISGTGEIVNDEDLLGILGKPDAVSNPISLSIYPASELEQRTDHTTRATLGYSEAVEPDPWCKGCKEEWYAIAYISDDILLKTIDIIGRQPPKQLSVSLSLNKGAYARRRINNSVSGSFEDTYQVTTYLGPNLDGWSDSTEAAEGNEASISIVGETYLLQRTKDEIDNEGAMRSAHERTALTLESLKASIEHFGTFLLIALGLLIAVTWFK